ncbi:MAG: glycosyltransferase family 2 protein [Bacillota bacterium]
MLQNKNIGVIVPAYNEERLIGKVFDTMPEYVDTIIVINDGSKDRTKEIILNYMSRDKRIILIDHEKNKGLGQSLIDGYVKSRALNLDVVAVMAGDAQMDPSDLINVAKPIIDGQADYVKGNRLLMENVYNIMPKYRFWGNSFLTFLTKFATGYWHIIDPQCGYTAISKEALKKIRIEQMIKGYGYNADILNMLNLVNAKVKDVEIKPVYGEEQSKIKLSTYIPNVSLLLLKLFVKRMVKKYLIREFHPLVFFYLFSFICNIIIGLPLIIRFFTIYFSLGIAPTTTLSILSTSFMMGYFSFFFGMWLDMEDNKALK